MGKSIFRAAFLLSTVFGLASLPAPLGAQGQQALVIDGGTLIDGNGGAPMPNAVIVVQGNRIAAVGARGSVTVPAGAQIINATGKFIIPGLIDGKSNWNFQYGEAYMHWGVTSAVVSGGRNDQGLAERDAINHGIFAGPRLFQTVVGLRGPGRDGKRRQSYGPGAGEIIPYTPEETRQLTKDIIAAGADFITLGDGDGPPELWAPAVEEAHKAGLAIACRCMGPQTRGPEAAMLGVDVLIHSGNLGVALSRDPEKFKDMGNTGRGGAEPTGTDDAFADMDPAKIPGVIALLKSKNVYVSPETVALSRPFYSSAKRVQQEAHTEFNDPNLRAYYSDFSLYDLYDNVRDPEDYLEPERIALRRIGFKNKAEFMRRYVEAGGKIVTASDITQSAPGLGVHQEMAIMQEDYRLPRMKIIQAATKWVAEGYRLPGVGSIETGKLADMVILDADPLADILNTRKISTVIKDGKVMDRAYHADYRGGMFTNSMEVDGNPVVGRADWAAALKDTIPARAKLRPGAPAPDPRIAPTPGIESFTPHTIVQGSPDTTIEITGFNFVKRSAVYVDGLRVPAEVVSHDKVRARLDQNLLSRAGKMKIVVRNPKPVDDLDWGDTSNTGYLLVPFSFTTKYFSKGSATR